jgi:DNA-binding cell septation regulator SpoVG
VSDKRPEPKQKTDKGLEIPVPKRRDPMDAFRKIIKPVKKP